MTQLTLTKEFLHNHGFGLTIDENGIFTNHDLMFKIEYLNFCKVDASVNNYHGLAHVYDGGLKRQWDSWTLRDGGKLKPVNFADFEAVQYKSKRTGLTKYINMINKTESFIIKSRGFDGVTYSNIQYGISEYYFKNFIPKMLKLNPGMKLMENQPEKEHNWANMKLYYFIDKGMIVGILAPASQEIE